MSKYYIGKLKDGTKFIVSFCDESCVEDVKRMLEIEDIEEVSEEKAKIMMDLMRITTPPIPDMTALSMPPKIVFHDYHERERKERKDQREQMKLRSRFCGKFRK